MTARFVILHHEHSRGEHWDLMLEHGEALITWQLQRDPVSFPSFPIPAHRIRDHRLAYLQYEGPLTRDRGFVRRIESGTVKFLVFTNACVEIALSGVRLSGRFRLTVVNDDWQFEVEDPI